MSDIELLSVIERYLNGEMNADERARFEMLRHDNPAVDSRVIEHQQFTERLKQYGERVEFEGMLNAIHNEIDVQALKDEFVHHPSLIVRIWRNHHSKISLAASVAIFAVLSALFVTGYFKSLKQDDAYINLKKDVERIKQTNKSFATSISHINNHNQGAPSNYAGVGTGFALSPDGYIATNFHVVQGADSVYVQNANGEGYHAKIVSVDPASDLAVLKITDGSFKSLGTLPYGFKKGKSSLGEDLFTIGYSKNDADEPVYNKGYLSSANGLKGDTLKYQLASMDVNFGNSGGPLLDSKGNVVGVISNKIEGASYAVKSKYLLKAVQSDSLINKLSLNTKSRIANLSRTQQIDKVQNYIFMVKVYNR
ncbi:protease Do [Mucilaginibacter sp. PPCGB 2223]|uniref:S1C family serine protease n=1 Tax=Mucilaginibacter sp. PPCGB 2223 TaxID=1886027 RepID=UPI000824BDC3|nr:serine protease [Mucilaginibacter sp. PPCGB 2223]OCX53603.1 protease Do [Mucilaginibacter sp. PPCGB 2223]